MGNKPLILAGNLFDTVVGNPTSTVTNSGGDDVAGHEYWRFADNLRDASFWTVAGTNSARALVVANQTPVVPVSPTILILDRGHNLAGATIAVSASSDNFVSSNVAQFSATIPTSAGGLPTGGAGCVTVDGVWWIEFTPSGPFAYWKVAIPALGAGIAPIVTGLYLGVAYRFPEYIEAPAALDFRTKLQYQRNVVSRAGLRIKSRPLNFGELDMHFQMEDSDYKAGFDTQVRSLLQTGAPWWFCLDDSDTTQSGLLRLFHFAGDVTYDPQANPVHREINLQLEEVFPRPFL